MFANYLLSFKHSVLVGWPEFEWCSIFECRWIVHQIQIDVSKTESFTASAACIFNFFRFMVGVPQFSDNKNFLTFYNTFLDFLLNRLTNFFFIFIQISRVNVTVAYIDGMFNGFSRFAERLQLKQQIFKNSNDCSHFDEEMNCFLYFLLAFEFMRFIC